MKYRIIFAPEAHSDYRRLSAYFKASVRDAIDSHLSHQPRKISRSRIKRLRGMAQPQFRLRVGDIRVFYDVVDDEVHVLCIIEKSQAGKWLEERGGRR